MNAKGSSFKLTLDNLAPATRLLDKKREMLEVQQTLDAHKRDFAVREENLKAKEEGLTKQNLRFRASLHKFNTFLQEQDLKRARAERKQKEESEAKLLKMEEIEKLKTQLEELRIQDRQTAAVVAKSRRYQDFLELACERSEDHKSADIEDFLTRHETLKAAHADLISTTRQVESEMEKARADMASYIREKSTEILRLNNEVAKLQKELDVISQKSLATAQMVEQTDRERLVDQGEFAQLCLASNNIFEKIMSISAVIRRPVTKMDAESKLHAQLTVIGQFIGDMRSIVEEPKPEDETQAPPGRRKKDKSTTDVSSRGDQE